MGGSDGEASVILRSVWSKSSKATLQKISNKGFWAEPGGVVIGVVYRGLNQTFRYRFEFTERESLYVLHCEHLHIWDKN